MRAKNFLPITSHGEHGGTKITEGGLLSIGGSLDEAMKTAIEYCIEHGLLKLFLEEHSSEAPNKRVRTGEGVIWRKYGTV